MAGPVLGIDLGTTYSAVAVMRDGKPQVIPSRRGGRLTPSMVGFMPSGKRVVGQEARSLAEVVPENVAYATKRFIGRRWDPELANQAKNYLSYALVAGPQGDVRVKIADKTLPLAQLSSIILGELKLDAQAYLGRPAEQVVITVPANFDDLQRAATKEAAEIAGLQVMRLVNEPTAAALAYGLSTQFQGRALVFDLGGGTFDVSVLEVQNGEFQVIATGGDPYLGGEDFDQVIVQWLLAQVPENLREAAAKDKLSRLRLKVAAEKAKRELSDEAEAIVDVDEIGDHGQAKRCCDLHTRLTRRFFEMLSEPLTKRCLAVCDDLMSGAQLTPSSIDAVLLVGGMTRVPLVRRLVEEYYGRKPDETLNPDEAVALGAAIFAAELASKETPTLLRDVASHSLGVGFVGGRVKRLIARNSPVPTRADEIFHPSRKGQTEARLPIYQGESILAAENTLLGEVVLSDLKGGDRTETELTVSFDLAADGTLSVTATDKATGGKRALTLQARTELSEAERRRLRSEETATLKSQGDAEHEALAARMKRISARSKELMPALQSATRMVPTDENQARFAHFDALLDAARSAEKAADWTALAEAANALELSLADVEKFVASV